MERTSASSTTTQDELARCIGSGTYGTVWCVKNRPSGKYVAVKHIKDVFISTKRAKMIFRELKILHHLKHDNVINVIHVMVPSSLELFEEVCITTEFVSADLHRLMYFTFPLSENSVQTIFYQVIRGLRYIHSARIIHRDLKPKNILVNENWTVKICDFGLSRREVPEGSRRRMTLGGTTYFYRAPEIYLETRQYSTAVDMWAAGCVLARLINRNFVFSTRIFKSSTTHLEEIVHLLGTPDSNEIDYASANMKSKLSKWPYQKSKMHTLRKLSPLATEEAVDLLSKLLRYDPSSRLSAADVLEHLYLKHARREYHTYKCECCSTSANGTRLYAIDLEPSASVDFDDNWESKITSVEEARLEMFQYLSEQDTIQKRSVL